MRSTISCSAYRKEFYHAYSTGDVMARATSDIESVRRYIGPAIMYIVRAGVVMWSPPSP